jgi:hypothetical protein
LAALLQSVGVSISKRQVQRLLTDQQADFVSEARDVLRAGLETSPHVSVDDTGGRHAGKNGFCTQIGNDWFGTRRQRGLAISPFFVRCVCQRHDLKTMKSA